MLPVAASMPVPASIIVIEISVTPTAIIVIEVPPPAIIVVSPATTVMFMLLTVMTPAARDACQLFVSEFDFYVWLDMCVHRKRSFSDISVFLIQKYSIS
jgi:hypothetical protein